MNDRLVSIIMPSYNSAPFISQAIESVLAQTYENWELLVVDDCSEDHTYKLVEQYCKKDNRIRLMRLKENSGAALARNRAIDEAEGRYIAFLDSDDMWKKEKLKKQVSYMLTHGVSFSYTAYDVINEEGAVINQFSPPQRICYEELLKTCSIGCLTAMYDTKFLGKVHMPLIPNREDYGLWLKLLKQTSHAYGLKESLALYRVREGSISANKIQAASFQWKVYREVERLNLIKSCYYFMFYAINGLQKYK